LPQFDRPARKAWFLFRSRLISQRAA
jgi:hypothetical protein